MLHLQEGDIEVHGGELVPASACVAASVPHLALPCVLRLQEGDLKYMVAFSSARAALEWCLMVQEASMYLNWPAGLSKIPQVGAVCPAVLVCVSRTASLVIGPCVGGSEAHRQVVLKATAHVSCCCSFRVLGAAVLPA